VVLSGRRHAERIVCKKTKHGVDDNVAQSGQVLYFTSEVTGEWRKLHNEERSDLYSLPNTVRVVKSRRM
jgi:hypothetical protein